MPRPRWALLYGVGGLAAGALAVIEVVAPAGGVRTGLGCGLTLGAFAAMARWVRRNRAALDLQEWCECAGARVTVRVIPSRQRSGEPRANGLGENLALDGRSTVAAPGGTLGP